MTPMELTAAIGSITSPIVAVWISFKVSNKHKTFDAIQNASILAVLQTDMTNLKNKFDKETSGNSSGFREAINTLKDGQVELKNLITNHNAFHLEQALEHGK